MSRAAGPLLATVLGLFATAAAPGAELGRLFLTPAERTALDEARVRRDEPVAVESLPDRAELEFEVEAVPDTRPALRVDGYVRRSGGPATVWVNGADSYQGDLGVHGVNARGVDVGPGGVDLPIAGTEETVRLKPGQTWDPQAGAVTDAYERRDEP